MSKQELVLVRRSPLVIDDRRTQVIRLLEDAFADDRLTLEELEQRLQRAHAATALATLDALVVDLVVPEPTRLRAVLGNLERAGVWQVPAQLSVSALCANAVVDFREAILTASVTVLDVRVACASLEILVPPEMLVEHQGSVLLGNYENHDETALGTTTDRPRLVIRGRVLLGNIEVFHRLPGECARDAKRRRKHERLALAAPRP